MPKPDTFEQMAALGGTMFTYQINRSLIEEKNTLAFTQFWNVQRIATAGTLRSMFGTVIFSIGGFDHDNRAIYEIPEVRNYLRGLADEWPYFFWADSLTTDFLIELIKCMVPTLTVVSTAKKPNKIVSQISVEEANVAYLKLVNGFVEVCRLDPAMNKQIFDSRIASVQAHLNKQAKPR